MALAQQRHQEALAIACERGDLGSQGLYLLGLGNVYKEQRYFSDAQNCYDQALAIAEKRNALDTQWRVRYALGVLCAAQQQFRAALNHYKEAIRIAEIQQSYIRVKSRRKFWQEKAILYKKTALCCWRLDDLRATLEYTEQAKAWQPLATGSLLGGSSYLCGIVADEPDKLAAQVLKTYVQSDKKGTIIATELPCDRTGLYGFLDSPYNWTFDNSWEVFKNQVFHF